MLRVAWPLSGVWCGLTRRMVAGVGDFPVGDQLVGKGFDLFGVQADAHRGGGDLLCFERYVHGAVARRDVGIVTRATA